MRQSAALMTGLIVWKGGELCRPGGCRRDQKVMMAFLATAPGPARQRGRRMFCPYQKGTGIEVQGGHAEYMLMNADATYLIPDKVSYEQAAPIFCAGYTVYSGLRWADPHPHERVPSTHLPRNDSLLGILSSNVTLAT